MTSHSVLVKGRIDCQMFMSQLFYETLTSLWKGGTVRSSLDFHLSMYLSNRMSRLVVDALVRQPL